MAIVKKLDEAGNLAGYWDDENHCWTAGPDSEEQLDDDDSEFESMTKDQLKAILDEHELEYDSKDTKAELVAILKAATTPQE